MESGSIWSSIFKKKLNKLKLINYRNDNSKVQKIEAEKLKEIIINKYDPFSQHEEEDDKDSVYDYDVPFQWEEIFR